MKHMGLGGFPHIHNIHLYYICNICIYNWYISVLMFMNYTLFEEHGLFQTIYDKDNSPQVLAIIASSQKLMLC